MHNDLLVLEAPSVVEGFRILNSIQETQAVRLVDAEPIGAGRFLVLLKGEAQNLSDLLRLNRDSLVDHELIDSIESSVLDATYSLASTKLSECLLVVETETASAMFSLAQTLVREHGLAPIEIRIRKSGAGGSYAYFTGSRLACAPATSDCRTRLKKSMREGTVELFEQLTPALRSLFELS